MLLHTAVAAAQIPQTNTDTVKTIDLKAVLVSSTRASDRTPMTFSELQREEIEANNLGKDLPYILELTPSAVTTSDAGAGVGYTGVRIRGIDATRVNVTLNGIPYNDPESMGVFWVNMPDFASSVSSIQVQRGLGTSTNGAGAFGASVNIETTGLNKKSYASLDHSFGSFDTRKHTVRFGTGLIKDRFAMDGRLSRVVSDGYIDRASSNLRAYYLSGAYYGKKSLIRFNTFAGHETTYQAWGGVPEAMLETHRTFNPHTYDNEVDDYRQTHYQLISAFDLSPSLTLNASFFLVQGQGYFEQYKKDEKLTDYKIDSANATIATKIPQSVLDRFRFDKASGSDSLAVRKDSLAVAGARGKRLSPEVRQLLKDKNVDLSTLGTFTFRSTDLIRRKWLDNNFYGATFSLDYHPHKDFNLIFSGSWNNYEGDHFGRVIWARYAGSSEIRHPYYFNTGTKSDISFFTKANYVWNDQWIFFGDLQYRTVDYTLKGTGDRVLDDHYSYHFFNPKVGVKYRIDKQSNAYVSYAIGNKEPNRSDFVDQIKRTPSPERLYDLEVGYERRTAKYHVLANVYWMYYRDQLVLTGAINDVGESLRTNVDESYRLGLELQLAYRLSDNLALYANATYSQNKIQGFTETLPDNTELYHKETDISLAPNLIGSGIVDYTIKGFNLRWIHKYVGKQYLDNASSEDRILKPYYVSDLMASYTFEVKGLKAVVLRGGVYNLFNAMYSANGYVYAYQGVNYEYYFPQAGTNYLLSLSLQL